MKIKKYKKSFDYSYTLGPFPSFELIEAKKEIVSAVFCSPDFNDKEKLKSKCEENGIDFFEDTKTLNVISDKEKAYVSAVFNKYECDFNACSKAHVVLHNISDMGNLGTIIRTLLGFGILNVALIKPCADIFNPKVIRASMGSVFKMNFKMYDSYEDYMAECGENRDVFPFMLTGNNDLEINSCPKSDKYALVFGNEASGLPKDFEKYTSIFIPQSKDVDSLNLAVSVAIGSFIFTSVNGT